MFRGSIVALLTPFRNGKVDDAALEKLIEFQIANGTDAIVPCGTTGESATLSHEEHRHVIQVAVETVAGRVPVIAGAGSNSTEEAIELTRFAADAGCDGALVVAPYYNKPMQEGLYQHFKAVHDAANIPILLYNVPTRTMSDISVDTMARLSRLPRIIGVKDATAKLDRVGLQRLHCGKDFVQLSGEDPTALAFNAQGGQGVISVTANVAPALSAGLQQAWAKGDCAKALEICDRLVPLNEALFIETNPGPVKFAAHLLGLCANELRLPLVPVSAATEKRVRQAMIDAGLAIETRDLGANAA